MKYRTIFIHFFICTFIFVSMAGLSPIENAVYAGEPNGSVSIERTGIELRAEQTEWRYRVVDGKLQKRLWSLTYGKWLTEWEWVE